MQTLKFPYGNAAVKGNFESDNVNDIPGNTPQRDQQALALTLHDGLDRLEEFVLLLALQGKGRQFEILSIGPPPTPAKTTTTRPRRKTENVVHLHESLLKKTA